METYIWPTLAKLLTSNPFDFSREKKIPGNNQHFFPVTTNTEKFWT